MADIRFAHSYGKLELLYEIVNRTFLSDGIMSAQPAMANRREAILNQVSAAMNDLAKIENSLLKVSNG